MKEIIMKNKILCVLILVMIAGAIVAATVGFKFDFMYERNTRIDVYVGKDYEKSDVDAIINEVFGKGKSTIQKLDTFNDRFSITVPSASDEQIAALKEKIVAKYELDTTEDNTQVTVVPHTRLRDIIRPYVKPVAVVTVLAIAYIVLKNIKKNPLSKLAVFCIALICAGTLYFSVIAITRLPIGQYTMPGAMLVYALVVMGTMIYLKKK